MRYEETTQTVRMNTTNAVCPIGEATGKKEHQRIENPGPVLRGRLHPRRNRKISGRHRLQKGALRAGLSRGVDHGPGFGDRQVD